MCGERWGQDGGRRAGSSLPAVLDGAQISAPPVPLWAHLELDQRRNSTAGRAEPGLTPNKPAPHCPALPSENHSQGPLPAPAHHALRLRAWGSLTPPEAPVSPLQLQLSLPTAPLPPAPTKRGGRWTPGGAALSLEDQAGPSVQQGSWQLPRAAPARQLQWMLRLSRHGAPETWAPWLQSDTTRPVHSSQILKWLWLLSKSVGQTSLARRAHLKTARGQLGRGWAGLPLSGPRTGLRCLGFTGPPMPRSSSSSLHWAPSARSLLWAPVATCTTGLGTGRPGHLADLSWLMGLLFLGSTPLGFLVALLTLLPAWGPAQVMGSPRAFALALPGPSPPQSSVPGLQPDHRIQAMRPPPVSWSPQAAVTNHPRLSTLNSKPRFLTVLEAGSPRSRC